MSYQYQQIVKNEKNETWQHRLIHRVKSVWSRCENKTAKRDFIEDQKIVKTVK